MSLDSTPSSWRNVFYPDSAAETQKTRGSAQTSHTDRVDSKNDWDSPRDLLDHSQIVAQFHRTPKPSFFRSLFRKDFRDWWPFYLHWCLLFLLQVLRVEKASAEACPIRRQALQTQEVLNKFSTEQPPNRKMRIPTSHQRIQKHVIVFRHTQHCQA